MSLPFNRYNRPVEWIGPRGVIHAIGMSIILNIALQPEYKGRSLIFFSILGMNKKLRIDPRRRNYWIQVPKRIFSILSGIHTMLTWSRCLPNTCWLSILSCLHLPFCILFELLQEELRAYSIDGDYISLLRVISNLTRLMKGKLPCSSFPLSRWYDRTYINLNRGSYLSLLNA